MTSGTSDWLLPSLVDHYANTEPDTVYIEYPANPTTHESGFKSITYGKLANAVNGAAAWIEKALGGRSDNHEVLAYMGPMDARFKIFILGAIKAGYQLLLPSPRNSVAAQQNLFKLTGCTRLLTTSPQPPFVAPIAAATNVAILQVPPMDDLLNQPHAHYPYEKTFEQAKKDPFLILHTSGSTGLPKPIFYTQEFPVAFQHMMHLTPPDGLITLYSTFHKTRVYSMLPPFHIAGIVINLVSAIFNKTVIITPLPLSPPTARGLVEASEKVDIHTVICSPLTCIELVKEPHLLDAVAKKVEYLYYGGGDCPAHVGDMIAKKIKFWAILGQSEYASLPQIRSGDPWAEEEWRWLRFNPISGIEFRQFDGDTYEQWIVRRPELEHAQTVFKVFPDLQEYCTKDLFTPHPTKPDLWTYKGRRDDIVVFLNGEKTNPVSFQDTISSHPDVTSALVIGAQRLRAAVLIEPKAATSSPSERAELLERLWPLIEQANSVCPAHAKVLRSHVLFTTPEKPMLRAGKGTVQRQQTLTLYHGEIDKLYADAKKQSPAHENGSARSASDLSQDDLLLIIRQSLMRVAKWNDIKPDEDIFARGLDSLEVLEFVRTLKEELACDSLAPSVVYTRRTTQSLALAIKDLERDEHASLGKAQQLRETQIESSVARLVGQLDGAESPSQKTEDTKRTILLTGSTGAIGSHILNVLLGSSEIKHVHCFNRSPRSAELQAERNNLRGLPAWDANRVSHLHGDLGIPGFGLDSEVLKELSLNVTDVIHAAWPLNRVLSLDSFEQQLMGVVKLSQFCASAAKGPRITFLSSVSAALGLYMNKQADPIVETTIDDASAPDYTGYGASKYVAERVLAHAHEKYGVPSTILRIGQVSGPSNRNAGKGWAEGEWFPSLIISSATLGALPDAIRGYKCASGDLPIIDFIPVDLVAKSIVEVMGITLDSATANGNRAERPAGVPALETLHLVSPKATSWKELCPAIQKTVESRTGRPMAIIPLQNWIAKAKSHAETLLEQPQATNDGESPNLRELTSRFPAIKLLDLYESWLSGPHNPDGRPLFETTAAEQRSVTLRSLTAVTAEQMEAWVEGWMPSV